jgi:hypothetical protein
MEPPDFSAGIEIVTQAFICALLIYCVNPKAKCVAKNLLKGRLPNKIGCTSAISSNLSLFTAGITIWNYFVSASRGAFATLAKCAPIDSERHP